MSTAVSTVDDEESSGKGIFNRAPFVYFGGKRKVAPLIWNRLGNPQVYVEPFAGSLAVLLHRPHTPRLETVGDFDGLIANVWRAIKHDPMAVAYYASDVISEIDLHAKHAFLLRNRADLVDRLLADPEYYDAKAAGWWVWGQASFIGGGWCQGAGSWQVVDGSLQKIRDGNKQGGTDHGLTRRKGVPAAKPSEVPGRLEGMPTEGINLSIPHLGSGRGVHRPGDMPTEGINLSVPHAGSGQGVNRPAIPGTAMVDDWGRYPGEEENINLIHWMGNLSERLRRVRICCGDFERTLGTGGTTTQGVTGVLLDPPYDPEGRMGTVYYHDATDVWSRARNWAAANGDNPLFRIALCGYSNRPHEVMPPGWTFEFYKATGGYGNAGKVPDALPFTPPTRGAGLADAGTGRDNAQREVIWFSKYCLGAEQGQLFNMTRDNGQVVFLDDQASDPIQLFSDPVLHAPIDEEPADDDVEDAAEFMPISIHSDPIVEEEIPDLPAETVGGPEPLPAPVPVVTGAPTPTAEAIPVKVPAKRIKAKTAQVSLFGEG